MCLNRNSLPVLHLRYSLPNSLWVPQDPLGERQPIKPADREQFEWQRTKKFKDKFTEFYTKSKKYTKYEETQIQRKQNMKKEKKKIFEVDQNGSNPTQMGALKYKI